MPFNEPQTTTTTVDDVDDDENKLYRVRCSTHTHTHTYIAAAAGCASVYAVRAVAAATERFQYDLLRIHHWPDFCAKTHTTWSTKWNEQKQK